MKVFNFQRYKKGIIKIEIKTFTPEKFINILWKSGIVIKNIEKKDITTIHFDIKFKDYGKIYNISKKMNCRIKVINTKGIAFFIIKTQKRMAFLGGILIFIGIIYYLSTFVWNVNIITENNVTPFEIRSYLNKIGIVPGISKKSINVYDIEEQIMKSNGNIMWVRARVDGSKLNINIAERQEPPKIKDDNGICNIVARKDGEIVRVYATAGTSVVSSGDIVKKGDVLVKGEQGKEENIYRVHASGKVIARTFYEYKKQVPLNYILKKRTGNKEENIFIKVLGKKVYLKKHKNKFKTCDKISIHKGILNKEIFYEVQEKNVKRTKEEVELKTSKELISKAIEKLDKSVKIVNKIIETKLNRDKYEVRVMLVVEEDIGNKQIVSEDDIEDKKDNKKDLKKNNDKENFNKNNRKNTKNVR